jgi:hypothetical protein
MIIVTSLLVSKELHRNDQLTDLKDIFEMRKNTNEAYTLFCDNVLSAVVGKNVWKAKCAGFTVSNIATISDKAFALVLLVNSWDVWSDTEKTGNNKTRFTRNGAGTKKNEGWTKEGLVQFNHIAKRVRIDRRASPEFEETYMREKLDIAAGKRMRRRDQEIGEDVEEKLTTYIEGDMDTSDDDDGNSAESGDDDES